MRKWLVISLLCLSSCNAPTAKQQSNAPVEKPDEAEALPEISVVMATQHSPEELISLLPNLDLCEAGTDAFYDDYASVLAPETDRCFPVAKNVRPHLHAVFRSMREMELFSTGLVGNHQGARIPGYAEHVLCWCFQHQLAPKAEKSCSARDVEQALSLMEKEIEPSQGDTREFVHAKQRFVSELNTVEAALDEQGRQYLRSELVAEIRARLRLSHEAPAAP